MSTLAKNLYRDSEFGAEQELPKAGSALENRFVYDGVARELKAMADRGLVEIVSEHRVQDADEELVDELCFRRLK